jgi:peptidoglycan/LPS O-acetylase OafA/YrhL
MLPLGQKKEAHFLYEIEGLRGILAMWVFISHLMWGSGFLPENVTGLWSVFFAGGSAVTVFICISGFVIFLLLDSKNESYLQYITKRFFRLYPIFIFTSIIGAFLFLFHFGVLGVNYQGPNVFVRSPEYYAQQSKILAMHTLMLQGLLKNLGPIVLNPPSWSISLEWQFYLVAPFLFYLFKKWWFGTALILIIASIVKNFLHPLGILNLHGAVLIDQIVPFTVGIVSYKLYQQRHCCQNPIFIKTLIAFVLLITLYNCQSFFISLFSVHQQVALPSCIPLAIWAVVLLTIIARTGSSDSSSGNIISRFLNHPYLQLLGKLSYSIYLIHQLVIFIFLLFAGSFILRFHPSLGFVFESLILIPTSLGLAYLINVFVEKPFIKIGKDITQRPIVNESHGQ